MKKMRHYSRAFVEAGGHHSVAETLNQGACDAMSRVVAELASAAPPVCVPLFIYAHRDTATGTWELTSLLSAETFCTDARRLIRKRTLLQSLLLHAPQDITNARNLLAATRSAKTILVIRLVIVFADESSHVNVVVIRRHIADHFEPKMGFCDTETRPFASVRDAVARMLVSHDIQLHPPPQAPPTLQTVDDLCQTWVVAYVVECVRTPNSSAQDIVSRLKSPKGCDRLCTLLRFSEQVYLHVQFVRTTRRGKQFLTLADRRFSTSRHFSAHPRVCKGDL